jgi:geranylgeranyl diphosphate synthase, type II
MPFDFAHAQAAIEAHIANLQPGHQPAELYDPIRYLMALGGKRMRPLAVLLGYQAFRPDWERAVPHAVAVEMFHNFTLMHDDIMDNAPLRRGQATVHEKWDRNVALLSGDVMLVKTYQLFLDLEPALLRPVLQKFGQCAAEVCEGQQLDMNFEARARVGVDEYLEMIRLKTAVLLGFSLELGAMLAGADPAQATLLYDFGVNLGIGFQLKDDLLDVYADQQKFGKQVGGDIIANKKTFLLIRALELANPAQRAQLDHWLGLATYDKAEKVRAITALYDELGIGQVTAQKMDSYFGAALAALAQIGLAPGSQAPLQQFADGLMARDK